MFLMQYPVITAHHATREDQLYHDPNIVTASTNRNLLQPTRDNKRRRKSKIESIQDEAENKKRRGSSNKRSGTAVDGDEATRPDREQLVDLVVEDDEAEELDRVRARKSGNPHWNKTDSKHFVKTYGDSNEAEEVREGFESDEEGWGTMTSAVQTSSNKDEPGSSKQWRTRDLDDSSEGEANVWKSPKG